MGQGRPESKPKTNYSDIGARGLLPYRRRVDSVTRSSKAFVDALAFVLKARRKAMELSQLELANRAGISHQHVGYVERGLRTPTADTLARMAIALECRLSDVCREAEERLSSKR